MKKWLAILVSVFLLVAMIPIGAVSVGAATASEIQVKLSEYITGIYKPNSSPPTNLYRAGTSGCYGFVDLLCREMFGIQLPGQRSGDAKKYQEQFAKDGDFTRIGTVKYREESVWTTAVQNLLSMAQSGDVIQMDYTDWDESDGDNRHVLMVYSVSPTGIVFYHAGKSKVYFGTNAGVSLWGTAGQELSWTRFASYFTSHNGDDGFSVYRPNIKGGVSGGTSSGSGYSSTNPDDYTFPTRSLYYTTPTMTGSDVAWVQAVLKKLGFSVMIDGKYGPTTRDIIKQFQTKYGLEVDGKCGPATRMKLQALWNAKKCTHTYSNDCDTICNSCGATRSVSGHTYSNACDATCNVCGTYRTPAAHSYDTYIYYEAEHPHYKWYQCSCGDTEGHYSEPTYVSTCTECNPPCTHTYDDDYDADCNECGEVRQVPEKPIDPVIPDLPADAPAFVVESTSARAGQEFTVAVRTERNSGIVSLKLNVAYDTDVLELVDAVEKDFAGASFGPLTATPFVVNWLDALRPDNTTDGVVTLLTFRVKEGAPIGKTDISLSYNPVDVFDQNYEDVAFRTESGIVEIVDYVSGDANGDGAVNNRDLALMQQYINGWEVVVDEDSCDVNGDDAINNRDLALLQQYINGWDVKLG